MHYLFKLVFLFSLDEQPEKEPLVHMVVHIFNFLRNFHTVFQGGCINLHSYQQCKRVPFSLHPRQLLLFLVFLMTVMLTGVSGISPWFRFIYFLIISLNEHLLMCLLTICISSLEKKILCPFCFNKGKSCILLEKNKCAQALRFNKSNFHCFTLSETFLFLKQYVHGGEEYNDY